MTIARLAIFFAISTSVAILYLTRAFVHARRAPRKVTAATIRVGGIVPPGASARLVCAPEIVYRHGAGVFSSPRREATFCPRQLEVVEGADYFTIGDIQCGMHSQLSSYAASEGVPAAIFSGACYSAAVDMDPISPTDDFALIVTNLAPHERRFEAIVHGAYAYEDRP